MHSNLSKKLNTVFMCELNSVKNAGGSPRQTKALSGYISSCGKLDTGFS